MKTVNISAETMKVVRSEATHTFKQTGVRRPDGSWDVPLNDDVIATLKQLAFPGESISDTIFRIIAVVRKRVQ